MTYLHTCTIGVVNLIMAVILLMHGDLLEFTSDVIRSTGINILVSIYSIGSVHHGNSFLLPRVILGIAPLAIFCNMIIFLTNLIDAIIPLGKGGTATLTPVVVVVLWVPRVVPVLVAAMATTVAATAMAAIAMTTAVPPWPWPPP